MLLCNSYNKYFMFRNLLNRLDHLLEDASGIDTDELAKMKSFISSKIKDLPEDDATIRALREIEDLLKHVNAGGKMGIINGELQRINDPTVIAAQKDLARYLLSMDMTPAQRDELFKLWRDDELVNRAALLKKKTKHTFDKIINGYSSNPAIAELVNDVMRIAALGQGKGEFGLSVLSKNINKQVGKGDLDIDGRAIEVKTTDGGAGRFTDQEVRPGEGFESAANELNKFLKTLGFKVVDSGVSLKQAVVVCQSLKNDKDKNPYNTFMAQVKKVINLIFDSQIDTTSIVQAIDSGNEGAALQEYAKASFNFYMGKKEDDGVLYINLVTEPITTVYFETADELTDAKLRLHAGTVYLTSVKDVRLPYPQMEIIDTTFGANAAARAEKAAAKQQKAAAKSAPKPSVMTGKTVDIRPIGAAPKPKKADLGRERR
jgi:hypothetical protein